MGGAGGELRVMNWESGLVRSAPRFRSTGNPISCGNEQWTVVTSCWKSPQEEKGRERRNVLSCGKDSPQARCIRSLCCAPAAATRRRGPGGLAFGSGSFGSWAWAGAWGSGFCFQGTDPQGEQVGSPLRRPLRAGDLTVCWLSPGRVPQEIKERREDLT